LLLETLLMCMALPLDFQEKLLPTKDARVERSTKMELLNGKYNVSLKQAEVNLVLKDFFRLSKRRFIVESGIQADTRLT
jgi:hypothetical protein